MAITYKYIFPYWRFLLIFLLNWNHFAKAHIRIIYPPARSYQFDFLDNVRTSGPCGVPSKRGPVTNLIPNSTFDVIWHLGYPHQGGYRIELIDSNNKVLATLAPSDHHNGTVYLQNIDVTTQSHRVTLPTNLTCDDCFLRLTRQAKEWTAGPHGYIFWSCADVRIQKDLDRCQPNGQLQEGVCLCNKGYNGEFCENFNECTNNADCNNGECIDINATSSPSKICFCKWGYIGTHCQKKTDLTKWNFDPRFYKSRQLSPRYNMYWKLLPDSTLGSNAKEIEIVLQANTTNWVALGWRPNNLRSNCKMYPINLQSGGIPLLPLPNHNRISKSVPKAESGVPRRKPIVEGSQPSGVALSEPETLLKPKAESQEPKHNLFVPISEGGNLNSPPASEPDKKKIVKILPISEQLNKAPNPETSSNPQNPVAESSFLKAEVQRLQQKEIMLNANVIPKNEPKPETSKLRKRQILSTTQRPIEIVTNALTMDSFMNKALTTEKPLELSMVLHDKNTNSHIIIGAPKAEIPTSENLPSAENNPLKPAKPEIIPAGENNPKPVVPIAVKEAIPEENLPPPHPIAEKTLANNEVVAKSSSAIPLREPSANSVKAEPESVGKSETLSQTKSEPVAENTLKVNKAPVSEPEAIKTPPLNEPTLNNNQARSEVIAEPNAEPKLSAGVIPIVPSGNIPVSEEDLNNIATKGDAIHPMECLDVVIGMARGNLFQIGDYYSRDRSTPMLDTVFGGRDDITAALGFERNGQTTIMFRRKLKSSDLADHTFINDIMHLSWATGQDVTKPVHDPPSGIEMGSAKDKAFYRDDELKYHGTSRNLRGTDAINFLDFPMPSPLQSGLAANSFVAQNTKCANANSGNIMEWSYPTGCDKSKNCQYHASWKLVGDSEEDIQFTIQARNSMNRWTGIGFSNQRNMPNTDIIYGWITSDNMVVLFDGWIEGYSQPTKDSMQNIYDINGSFINNVTTIQFKRKRQTEDKFHDFQFGDSDNDCGYFFFPYDTGEWNEDGTIQKHRIPPYVTDTKICIKKCMPENGTTLIPVALGATLTENPIGSVYNLSFAIDEPWKGEYSDLESPETQLYKNELEIKLRNTLMDLPEFQNVKIANLRPGSVIIETVVFMSSPNLTHNKALMDKLRSMETRNLLNINPQNMTINLFGCYANGQYYVAGSPEKITLMSNDMRSCQTCNCTRESVLLCQAMQCPTNDMDFVKIHENGQTNAPFVTNNPVIDKRNSASNNNVGVSLFLQSISLIIYVTYFLLSVL